MCTAKKKVSIGQRASCDHSVTVATTQKIATQLLFCSWGLWRIPLCASVTSLWRSLTPAGVVLVLSCRCDWCCGHCGAPPIHPIWCRGRYLGRKFLHYWTGSVGDASGVLLAWVGLPLGLVQCAWCSSGEKKTDEQDELMNTALMSAKNNMKDDQNHALFCNQLTSAWQNNFKRMYCLFRELCISTTEKKQRV